jgi:predicted RecB family nuclease
MHVEHRKERVKRSSSLDKANVKSMPDLQKKPGESYPPGLTKPAKLYELEPLVFAWEVLDVRPDFQRAL